MSATEWHGVEGSLIAPRLDPFLPSWMGSAFISQSGRTGLHPLAPSYVQVSIDGAPSVHDANLGLGNYDKAMEGLRCLSRNGITSMVSFTAHRGNHKEFGQVANARKAGAAKVWADRLIPVGTGSEMSSPVLGPDETKEDVDIITSSRTGRWPRGPHKKVAMDRALHSSEALRRLIVARRGALCLRCCPTATWFRAAGCPWRSGTPRRKACAASMRRTRCRSG